MASLQFTKAVVAVLLAFGTTSLAAGATFDPSFNGCTEGGNISVDVISSHNGNTGAKLYGDCALFWETSWEEGSMVSLSVAMGGPLDSDPGPGLIPISWRFSLAEIGLVPATQYFYEVWMDRDWDHLTLATGEMVPGVEVNNYAHISFEGATFWVAGITITADVPAAGNGAFRLDILQDSLDVNSPSTPPPPPTGTDVPEPGSAVLLLSGATALLLLRRRR